MTNEDNDRYFFNLGYQDGRIYERLEPRELIDKPNMKMYLLGLRQGYWRMVGFKDAQSNQYNKNCPQENLDHIEWYEQGVIEYDAALDKISQPLTESVELWIGYNKDGTVDPAIMFDVEPDEDIKKSLDEEGIVLVKLTGERPI